MENKKMKILAIDDNPDNLITIKALIMESFSNAMVISALNGIKGLELAAEHDPDVILLDIVMPEMDGYEVCEKLKADKNTCNIPVVFVTALKGDRESRIRALEVGGDAFLAKPIDQSELVAQIRAMVKIKTALVEKLSENERLAELVEQKTQEISANHAGMLNLLEDLKNENLARKESENALRESEEKYRTLIQFSSDPIFSFNPDGTYRFVNERFALTFGKKPNEIIGKTPHFLFPPDEAELRLSVVRKVFQTGEKHELDVKLNDLKGEVQYLITLIDPIKNEKGEVIYLSCISKNITERKKIEIELHESEAKYRDLANLLPQIIFETDLKGNLTYVNKQAYSILGYSEDDKMIGKSTIEIYIPEHREKAKENLKRRLNGELVENTEYTMIKKDGSTIPTLIYSSLIIKDNEPIGLRGLIIDISDRKQAENKIKESEEKYRELVENSPDAIAIYVDAKIVFVNSQCKQLMAASSNDELLGKSVMDFVHPDYREFVLDRMKQAVIDNSALSAAEEVFLRLDGTSVDVDVKAMPVRFENKPAVLIIVRDITERKLAQETLRESEEKYRFMFANNPQPMFIYDFENLTFLEANQSAISHYGYSREEFLSMTIKDIRPPEYIPALLQDIEEAKNNKSKTYHEWVHLLKSGEEIIVEVTAVSIISNGRKARHILINDITERKRAEKELRIVNSKYFDLYTLMRLMSDTMPDLLWAKDLNGNFTFTNKAMCETVLQAKDTLEPIGKNDMFFANRERSNQPENPDWFTFGEICVNSDVVTMREMKQLQFDEFGNIRGKFLFLDVHKAPLYNENNELIGIVGSARDITESKYAEEKLKASEDKYRTMIENSNDLIWMLDVNANFTYVNQIAAQTTELIVEDWIGKSFAPLLFEEDLPMLMDIFYRTLQGETCKYELRFPKKDNTILTISVNTSPMYNLGKIDGMVSFGRDITERKLTEDKIKASEEKYRSLMDNSPEGITIYVDGVIAYVNNESMRLMRATDKNQLLGKTIVDFIHPDNQALVLERISIVALAPINAILPSVEEKYIRLDGTEVDVEIKVMPIIYEGKHAIQLSGHDITDRKHAEAALQESEIRLNNMFEFSPISIWDEDFSAVKEAFDLLKEQGITNFREYFSNNSEALSKAISLIKVTAINETSVEIFGIESKDEILNNLSYYFYDNISEVFAEEFIALAEGRTHFEGETVIVTKNGLQKHLLLSLVVMPGYEKTLSKVLVSFIDITKRKLAEIALLKSQQELKSFTAHLQNVREEEKIAVAREIHDDLGQILVALKIDMGMLRNKISKRSDIIISEDVLL